MPEAIQPIVVIARTKSEAIQEKKRHCEGESVYKVTSKHIVTNNLSELLIIAPKMVTGELVRLKITTQFMSSAKFLKDPRSVTFDKELTVV